MDITTIWNTPDCHGVWQMNGADLLSGNDLSTAILISVFTDRTALADDVIPDGTGDPRGWWGDVADAPPIGSRLWLLSRAKQTDETLRRAYDYLVEALQWLIDDDVVARFDVLVQWIRPSMLGAQITAHRVDGTITTTRFDWAWNGIT